MHCVSCSVFCLQGSLCNVVETTQKLSLSRRAFSCWLQHNDTLCEVSDSSRNVSASTRTCGAKQVVIAVTVQICLWEVPVWTSTWLLANLHEVFDSSFKFLHSNAEIATSDRSWSCVHYSWPSYKIIQRYILCSWNSAVKYIRNQPEHVNKFRKFLVSAHGLRELLAMFVFIWRSYKNNKLV